VTLQLDIPAVQWGTQNINAVRDALTRLSADPERARASRGSVVLRFSDALPEFNPYLNSGVAAFLQSMYEEFPHILYFLDPDPAKGALEGYFASVGALYENQFGAWILWDEDVANALYEALADAAEFAIAQDDDWVAVAEAYEYDERQTRFKEIRAILIARGVIPE
jgi:hypothetical protein